MTCECGHHYKRHHATTKEGARPFGGGCEDCPCFEFRYHPAPTVKEAEPTCERCSPTCRFEGRADDHLRYSRGFGQGSDIGRCSDDEECECDAYRPAESEGKCGSGIIAGRFLVGCDRPFKSQLEIFRCYDCEVPFHRDCLKKHCKEGFRFGGTHADSHKQEI